MFLWSTSCPEEIGEIYVEDEDVVDEEEIEDMEVRPSVDPVWTAHADRYRHGNGLTLALPERDQSTDPNEMQVRYLAVGRKCRNGFSEECESVLIWSLLPCAPVTNCCRGRRY